MREYGKNRREKQAWLAQVSKAMPTTGVRTRPRDPEEARLLRRLGTPERLIGPTRAS